ncbi:MarR family winged helix-turn-helix transcriptional regulator [Sphingomonas quercus]|uniref:MarR family transcriptional regulator n=1 Tax=Sphingomonas quercus TaxID=2842451 RepID=A0ABS6BMG3_9SPHN|nr:MarR family transcriptional regulator [Sphingomonas quercus]MBU3079488.1 MarR family transcriptional regulator [Sphingomonas quercus]
MHQAVSPDSRCLCTALRKASRALSRVYDASLEPAGLTITQFSILRTLAREGDMPLSRLADQLMMDRTSLYRTLAPLAREGNIALADARTGNARIATLTPEGRAAIEAATGPWADAQGRIAGAFDASGWAALEDALHRLAAIAAEARD